MSENPYLLPGDFPTIHVTYQSVTLGGVLTLSAEAVTTITKYLDRAGYARPARHIIEDHTAAVADDGELTLTFPGNHPVIGEPRITLVDVAYQHRVVTLTHDILDWTGPDRSRMFLDLDTGQWIVFTSTHMPSTMSAPYRSRAVQHPVPEKAI